AAEVVAREGCRGPAEHGRRDRQAGGSNSGQEAPPGPGMLDLVAHLAPPDIESDDRTGQHGADLGSCQCAVRPAVPSLARTSPAAGTSSSVYRSTAASHASRAAPSSPSAR